MRDILVVIVYLLCASVTLGEMTTGPFVRCFREWTNADQVKVSCNGIMIAQYCDTGKKSCRKMNNSGVSLEKDGFVYLTITNRTYDSWPCEAQCYIDDKEQTDTFTVDFINQHTSSSPSPVTTSSSPSPVTTSSSPSPGNKESHSGAIAAGVSVPIICLLLLLLILYWKRNPKEEQEIGTGEKFLPPCTNLA